MNLLRGLGNYITLVRVEIKERSLSFLRSSSASSANTGSKKSFMHEYVVLTVMDRNNEEFSFVAEKINQLSLCERSFIRIVREEASSDSSRFVWRLYNRTVPESKLESILTNTGDRYNWFSDNCWKYARDTVEGVLNLCWKEAKEGYEEGLRGLETVRRVLPRESFTFFVDPFRFCKWLTRFFTSPSPRNYDYTNMQRGLTVRY